MLSNGAADDCGACFRASPEVRRNSIGAGAEPFYRPRLTGWIL